jgi:exodeoxyribonuclease VII large subunit
MPNIYLNVDFKEKDAAKALGARWDGGQRQWYVPEGRELAPFAQWLPSTAAGSPTALIRQGALDDSTGTELDFFDKKGASLSTLLAGVSQAVAQAYKAGVWVLVEVVELRANGGHVFMGVSERDTAGAVLAKASAVIWQTVANIILPEFERATGVELAPGIKLLVRARPVFKALHGFSLEVDAIDLQYTLGELEARKQEIRERLRAEGVATANKLLPVPWDFNAVLVVAPEGGAGLGDFQAEANRLERFGVCRFSYVYSRFQGAGAAQEVCDALQAASSPWSTVGRQPDAVVIIRGGGAVNDLAWLNDYDLARFICDLNVPVFTGIGHERDSTVLDEVAHTSFDTPSKVIAGIEQTIVRRAAEAKANFELITRRSSTVAQSHRANSVALDAAVRSDAIRHLAVCRQSTQTLLNDVRLAAMNDVRSAAELSHGTVQRVKSEAFMQIAQAKQDVPTYWGQITMGAKHALHANATAALATRFDILEQAKRDLVRARTGADSGMVAFFDAARLHVRELASRSESLMREVSGQGPDKTLRRGFVLVRDQAGESITRAVQAVNRGAVHIQFSDGTLAATVGKLL